MNVSGARLLATCMLMFICLAGSGQYNFYKPDVGFGIETSLSNTSLTRMPMYRNAIASLAVTGDLVIGGTAAESGLSPYVFAASLSKKELITIEDLAETIKGQQSIRSGFFKMNEQQLYAGTMGDTARGNRHDGHLIGITVDKNAKIRIDDLGVPVKGEGIFAIAGDARRNMIYGVTYPAGLFFSYDIATRVVRKYDQIVPSKADLEVLEGEFHQSPEEYVSNALIVSRAGRVYGSKAIGKIFCFDPNVDSFRVIGNLPEVWGRVSLGRVEAWAESPEGLLYGGNGGDGQLFVLDPATNELKNLGKPAMMPRLRGLCFAADGKLYGLTGALPGYVHLFSYDPKHEGFADMGNPQFTLRAPGIEQGIEWRGFQLRTIAASADGSSVVMGEDEALSQLLVLPVIK